MRVKLSSVFLIFLVLVGLFGISVTLTFQNFKATFLPLFMSSVIFVLSAIELTREFRGQASTPTDTEAKPVEVASAKDVWRRFGSALGWIVGFFFTIYVAGFLIAIPLFVASYLKRQGYSWLLAIGVAILVIAFIYGAFELGLRAQLYKGLIFGARL